MDKKAKVIRQGDVWLVPIAKADADFMLDGRRDRLRVRRPAGESMILAAGEATGHHHRVKTRGARLYTHPNRRGDRIFHAPKNGAVITHEEHAPLTIPEGDYEVRIAREYEPGAAPRRVYD